MRFEWATRCYCCGLRSGGVHKGGDAAWRGRTAQGGLDHRVSGAIITASECCALLAAFVIVLSMLGVNVSALLLPAGVALAFAAKDLSHNFLAGARRNPSPWNPRTLQSP